MSDVLHRKSSPTILLRRMRDANRKQFTTLSLSLTVQDKYRKKESQGISSWGHILLFLSVSFCQFNPHFQLILTTCLICWGPRAPNLGLNDELNIKKYYQIFLLVEWLTADSTLCTLALVNLTWFCIHTTRWQYKPTAISGSTT